MQFKEFLNESINDKGILKAIFVCGIPGAGKTYTVSQLSGTISPKIVNTDKATEFLSTKYNMIANSTTWKTFFQDNTQRITSKMLFNYTNSMLPLFIDGTSNDVSNLLTRVGILESLGYDIGIVFINTNLDTAIERVKHRSKISNRHVDEEFVKQIHSQVEDNKNYLKSKFDFFKEVSNNPGELDNKAILSIFKEVSSFYNEPLRNIVGIRTLEKMKKQKQSYLVPSIYDKLTLEKKLNGWYRS